ncbi:hypothetical protein CH362_00875 [Leptospira saintgironsiae]|uniref:Uncharacterized protein n=1 Tax=Leptospira saintgironsiae TaxID=2023183 RepID=A0A2M9YFP8_9LEPT|nr:hypothetical protein CH362_00875 [Leptospira saintgironsiae]
MTALFSDLFPIRSYFCFPRKNLTEGNQSVLQVRKFFSKNKAKVFLLKTILINFFSDFREEY